MASTVADLKAQLHELGVEYDAKAKKAELEELVDQHSSSTAPSEDTGGSSPEAPGAEEGVGAEGATDLTPQPGPVPEDYDGPVLLGNLLHHGRELSAGTPVPTDLDEADVERLQRLGIVPGGEVEVDATGFESFKGADDQWYWHLRAENGEIIAQSEGYSSHKGALDGIEAVKDAVRDAILAD